MAICFIGGGNTNPDLKQLPIFLSCLFGFAFGSVLFDVSIAPKMSIKPRKAFTQATALFKIQVLDVVQAFAYRFV